MNRETAAGSTDRAGSNFYILPPTEQLLTQMIETAQKAGLLALYQFTVALGILMMPIALLARRAGVRLPVGRIVAAVGTAYENVDAR